MASAAAGSASTPTLFRLRPVFAFLIALALGILVGPSLPLPPFFLGTASLLIFAIAVSIQREARPLLALSFFCFACLLLGRGAGAETRPCPPLMTSRRWRRADRRSGSRAWSRRSRKSCRAARFC